MSTTYWIMIVWYISGVCSFVYWWTKDYDLKFHDALFGVFIGFMGPLNFIFGWSIHSKEGKDVIIIKRRGNTKEGV